MTCDYLYDNNKCIVKGECDKKDTCPLQLALEKQKNSWKKYLIFQTRSKNELRIRN